MKRTLTPELLDSLPPDHPDAIRSRRDLRLLHRVMGNGPWFAHTLAAHARPGERILELGAGEGTLARCLHAHTPALAVDGLDRIPAPVTWPASARWHQADITTFTGWAGHPVVIGNLILHHFDAATLAALGAAIRPHARLLLFCEPLRFRRGQLLWAVAAPLFGANHVTRHDGHVSIAAGFRDDELLLALGLDPAEWSWSITTTRLGIQRILAEKRA